MIKNRKIIRIHFDGACRNIVGQNNPMGIGIAVFIEDVYSPENSNAIYAIGLGEELGTSNISEWKGCVEAIRKANRMKLDYPDHKFMIYSDSELITKQFNGDYEVKKNEFKKYYTEAHRLGDRIKIGKVTWISREFNKEADVLSKQGLKQLQEQE